METVAAGFWRAECALMRAVGGVWDRTLAMRVKRWSDAKDDQALLMQDQLLRTNWLVARLNSLDPGASPRNFTTL